MGASFSGTRQREADRRPLPLAFRLHPALPTVGLDDRSPAGLDFPVSSLSDTTTIDYHLLLLLHDNFEHGSRTPVEINRTVQLFHERDHQPESQ